MAAALPRGPWFTACLRLPQGARGVGRDGSDVRWGAPLHASVPCAGVRARRLRTSGAPTLVSRAPPSCTHGAACKALSPRRSRATIPLGDSRLLQLSFLSSAPAFFGEIPAPALVESKLLARTWPLAVFTEHVACMHAPDVALLRNASVDSQCWDRGGYIYVLVLQ
ncbi:hypothetical protein SEVIR_4G037950v4 [Setaria viridis]